jgi:hypothetical protein
MNDQTAINDSGQSQVDSRHWGVEYLCDRFGLSLSTAQEIAGGNWGDRGKMEQEAERLANYEKLYRRTDRLEPGVVP